MRFDEDRDVDSLARNNIKQYNKSALPAARFFKNFVLIFNIVTEPKCKLMLAKSPETESPTVHTKYWSSSLQYFTSYRVLVNGES